MDGAPQQSKAVFDGEQHSEQPLKTIQQGSILPPEFTDAFQNNCRYTKKNQPREGRDRNICRRIRFENNFMQSRTPLSRGRSSAWNFSCTSFTIDDLTGARMSRFMITTCIAPPKSPVDLLLCSTCVLLQYRYLPAFTLIMQ